VRRWQADLEVARVRDHRELLNLGRRIETENAAINRELAQQGATITEVLRVIHVRALPSRIWLCNSTHSLTYSRMPSRFDDFSQDINAGLQNAHFVPGTVKVAMPLSATPPDAGSRKTLRMSFYRGRDDNEDSRRCRPSAHAIAAATSPPVPVPVPVRTAKMIESDSGTSKSPVPCGSYTSPRSAAAATKSKSATRTPRHHLRLSESLTKKCVKMVPLANVVFSKLYSSRSPSYSSPLHGTATRSASSDLLCGRLPGLKTVSSAICDDDDDEDDVGSSALSSSWCHLPVEPPPPYQLRVANPGPECGCPMEGGADDVGHHAAAMSSSRITTASVEAIRAPDSPVPVFPSPKLSTDSVFGSTQSLASVSSGRSGTNPGPHYRTPRNSASGHTGPMLRRRDTIIFARRVTMSSGHSNMVEPIIRPL
jgi:hypothetical protein